MLEPRQRLAVWGGFAVGVALVLLVRGSSPSPALDGNVHTQAGPAVTSVGEISLDQDWPLTQRVEEVAMRNHLDPALVLAVIEVESGRDVGAVSDKGAVGLMQLMPETAAMVGYPDPADPLSNLEAGSRYLAALLESFGGDVELALAAYNAGPGAVRRWGTVPPYRETRDFVRRVAAAYRRITGLDIRSTTRLANEWESLAIF